MKRHLEFFGIVLTIGLALGHYSPIPSYDDWRHDAGFLDNVDRLHCLIKSLYPCQDYFYCANRAILYSYYTVAGSPRPDDIPRLNNMPYCMKDHDCKMYTVYKYTQSFGKMDCNCDNKFDYTDRLAILLAKDKECGQTTLISPGHVERYNNCALDLSVPNITYIGAPCTAPILPEKEPEKTIENDDKLS